MTENDSKKNFIVEQKPQSENWKQNTLSDSVLRLIWRNNRISRIDIAKQLGIARSTVTEIVKDLINDGYVIEVGTSKSKGGRKAILLEFQDEARCILGVDIGATHVSVALTNLRGELIEWKEKQHTVRTDPEGTRKIIFELCDSCLASWNGGKNKLLSIGVAVPSPVDPMHPEWVSEVVIPSWKGTSELEKLHKRYGVPVYVDNDANLGAFAEYNWGAGKGVKNLIYIKLGRGIGAGYILDGDIYRGAKSVAGEIGHLPIDLYGKQCVCGLRGCLVTFIGSKALELRAKTLLPDQPDSILFNRNITSNIIEEAAVSGDALAIRIIHETAEYLGIAIASWLNLMNPDMVILGGSLTRVGDLLLNPIREKVKNCTLVSSAATAEIRASELGSKAIAIGAATLALEEAFAEPDIFRQRPHAGKL